MSGSEKWDPIDQKLLSVWWQDALQRCPDQKAWARFIYELRCAAYLEQNDITSSNLAPPLEPVVATIAALHDFLLAHDFIIGERLHLPTVRIAMGLMDIYNGQRSPLFEPTHTGKSRKRAVQANVSAVAARALSELVNCDIGLKEAAIMVSRAVHKGKLAGYSKCTASTVQNWRARLEEGEGGATDIALQRYRAPLPAEAGDDSAARAEYLLNILRTSVVLRHG